MMRLPTLRRQATEDDYSIPTIPTEPRPTYQRRLQAPQFFYLMSAIGLIAITGFILSFLVKTPIGINGVCGLFGFSGIGIHWALTYYSAKPKEFAFWMLWTQSGFMVALSFYLGAKAQCL
jgi:hypothetical protein